MTTWQLDFELHESATFGSIPLTGSECPTLTFIPATVIRGALAAALARTGRTGELDNWFGLEGPRWSPAWPVALGAEHVVPMPLSYLADKGDKGFGGAWGVWDALCGRPPDRTLEQRHQWQRMRAQWLALDGAFCPVGVVSVETRTDMHVALHYGRQSHRTNALYSRQYLPADTAHRRFRSWVSASQSEFNPESQTLYFGKRRSLGGGASLSVIPEVAGIPVCRANNPKDNTFYLQLLTDALVPARRGGWHRGLTTDSVRELTGPFELEVQAAFSSSRQIPGWSGSWGSPREQAIAIAAGSVYSVHCPDEPGAQKALLGLAAGGIGIRRKEGFGFVAVNPEWLAIEKQPFGQSASVGTQPEPVGRASAWPGSTGVQTESLRALAGEAVFFQKHHDHSAKLRALASLATRLQSTEQVRQYVVQMKNRKNPRQWDELAKLLEPKLAMIGDMESCRFYLETTALFAAGNRKDQ